MINAPLSRRKAISRTLTGVVGMGLSNSLLMKAWGATPPAAQNAKAKSVIQIWLWGGPAHLDTFDPKPDAGSDYCGPFNHPIETNVSGIRIGEQLPLLAKQADKYSIIRSMTHGNNAHETATYMMQTGRTAGERLAYPCAGSVVSRFKGYDGGYSGQIPPYIVLTEPLGRFAEEGFLGSRYKPFMTGGDPAADRFRVEGVVAEGITNQQQRARRNLLNQLDMLPRKLSGNASLQALVRSREQAYDMILGDAANVFNLSDEDENLRERYGRSTLAATAPASTVAPRTSFGQSCLVARRLVEHGVPYITINYPGWDTHKDHFTAMKKRLPEFDQGLSTLLQDLSERGLLDSTVVWVGGEFGRTPKIDWGAPWNGGRGHYGKAFSHLIAGGGFSGGQVVGSTDARGEEIASRPVYPRDLIGTIYRQLGIPLDAPLPNPQGIDTRILPMPTENIPTGGLLNELI